MHRPSVDRIAVGDLFAEGVLIDISRQAASDADYALRTPTSRPGNKRTAAIPDRAVVLLKTGWGRHFKLPSAIATKMWAGKCTFQDSPPRRFDF